MANAKCDFIVMPCNTIHFFIDELSSKSPIPIISIVEETIKKIKEERKSNAYTQTIQGYIIYFFFVFIMIVLQVYLIPKLGTVGGELGQGLGTIGISGLGGGSTISFDSIFIATIIVQGLFAGLMLGKFAEGDYKSGLKHSLIMVIGGYLIITTAAGIVKPQQSLILLIPYYFMKKDNNVK